jgi:hypothetical protein
MLRPVFPCGRRAVKPMSNEPDPLIARVLQKKLEKRDEPTDTHFTLEVVAYWKDDLLDSVRAGRKRSVIVGGYHANRRADLQVELPQTLRRFVIARVRGKEALITVPKEAQVALQLEDGTFTTDVPLESCSAPFPAGSYRLGFRQRICFKIEALSFLVQWVHRDGQARTPWDWLIPRRFAGEP